MGLRYDLLSHLYCLINSFTFMKLKLTNRKITRLSYSYFVSLPMGWVRGIGLKKGDIIEPTLLEDGSLLLKPIR